VEYHPQVSGSALPAIHRRPVPPNACAFAVIAGGFDAADRFVLVVMRAMPPGSFVHHNHFLTPSSKGYRSWPDSFSGAKAFPAPDKGETGIFSITNRALVRFWR
jgi:hypothetical protein